MIVAELVDTIWLRGNRRSLKAKILLAEVKRYRRSGDISRRYRLVLELGDRE